MTNRVIGQHYGLELHEGDAIMLRLPPVSELQRDAEWAEARGWHWSYWPDGSKTLDFPRGRVRMKAGTLR